MFDKSTRAGTTRLFAVAAFALLASLTEARAGCQYQALGTLPLRQGEAYPIVDGTANGVPVRVLLDTGAGDMLMSPALAKRLRLPLGHTSREHYGVGGTTEVARVHLDSLTLGKFEWTNVTLLVAQDAAPDMPDVIAGARFLLQHDLEMTDKAITFFEPIDSIECYGAPLAYWAPDVPWIDIALPTERHPQLSATVKINGHPVQAMVDTGAGSTVLDLQAARDLGGAPKSVEGTGGGIGGHRFDWWHARFDSVAVGPEIVHNVNLSVADMWGAAIKDLHAFGASRFFSEQEQMLLGYDFLKAHRVLFAVSQHRLYFSYAGGPIFARPTQGSAAVPPASAASGAGRAAD